MNYISFKVFAFALFMFLVLLIGSHRSFAQQAPGQTVNSSNSQLVANQAAPSQNNSLADLANATSQAVAGPFDLISTRIISDPLYLPLKGQFYGSTEYKFNRTSYSEDTYTGSEYNTAKIDG